MSSQLDWKARETLKRYAGFSLSGVADAPAAKTDYRIIHGTLFCY